MATIKSYKELIVWQKSMMLAKEVYILTEKFPKSEVFGIVSQMRRASVAIPSNIAEGFGRRTIKSSIQFYSVSYASALELETQLILSKELNFVNKSLFTTSDALLEEVSKILNVLILKMKNLSRKEAVTSI